MAITYSLIPADAGGDDLPEGTGTPSIYRFQVQRSIGLGDGLIDESLDWSVSGSGTSAADGFDFSLDGIFNSGSVHFAAGSALADTLIEFNTVADSNIETDETFSVTLTDASTATVATAIGVIRNDDFNVVGGTGGANNLVGST